MKKLKLHRETIRHLGETGLVTVGGGIPSEPFGSCHSDQWSDCASPTCDPGDSEIIKRV